MKNAGTALRGPSVVDQPSPTAVRLPASPSRLLIADDEHLVTAGLSANLKELGYTVIGPASDGDEAIEICRNNRPDMALLDIRMPKKDGLATAEILFGQYGVPVVMLSAYSDPEYVSTANHIGVFGYILKPVTADQLRVNISIAWGRYADFLEQHQQIEGLKSRLADRKVIEQAKWVIVKRKNISEPDAMRLLQTRARNNRRTLADIARSVLENEDLFSSD